VSVENISFHTTELNSRGISFNVMRVGSVLKISAHREESFVEEKHVKSIIK
jgi:hypothetical protein